MIKPTPKVVVLPDADDRPSILALAYAGIGDKNAALEEASRAVAQYDTDAVNKPPAEAVLAQIQATFAFEQGPMRVIEAALKRA